MPNLIIGIDPGLTGGICILQDGEVKKLISTPTVGKKINFWELVDLYHTLCVNAGNTMIPVIIEKAFILPTQRANEMIWRNYERLMLAFEPEIEVRSQEWKKALNIPVNNKKLKIVVSKKDAIKYQYERICPERDINDETIKWYKQSKKTGKYSPSVLDDGKIDAYCIALYGYKKLFDN